MSKTAFLFAGQGSQHVGMGRDLYETYPVFREVIDGAHLDFDLRSLMFEGPDEQLSQTHYTQPCMVAFAAGMTAVLDELEIKPDYVAGLSLGEYSALAAAGVFEPQQAIQLAAFRGSAMARASEGRACAMVSILGLARKAVESAVELAAAAGQGTVEVSNYNCPGQLVVSGLRHEIEALRPLVKEAGGRMVPLAVSGGFHSPFMDGAAEAFAKELAEIDFRSGKIPVYANLTAKPYADGAAKSLLAQQMNHPVHWEQTLRNMAADGFDTFIEVGPGKTLSGLAAKTLPGTGIYHVEDEETLKTTVKAVLKG